jgi:phosphoribosylformylglycinamidine cyclo-ligase
MERKQVISNDRIQPGNVIVGLASFGKAIYETEYNGGMGSNGLTSARHDVFNKDIAKKYPETYDHTIPEEYSYSGSRMLTEASEVAGVTIGKLVLSPTRTYAPIVKTVLENFHAHINGIVHCSGGAQTKVLHFINDDVHVIKNNLFPIPPLFNLIHAESNTDWAEMYKVFNMGHRLEIYTNEKVAQEIIGISKSFNVDAQIIGYCIEGNKGVTIQSPNGVYNY